MIFCNLKMLLSARNLRISRVANDTGISRTTLTSLSQNDLKGVQLTTLDTLCQYLEIDPKQFFEYHPFTFYYNVDVDWANNKSANEDSWTFSYDASVFLNVFEKGVKTAVIEFAGTLETTPSLGYHPDDPDNNMVSYSLNLDIVNEENYSKYLNQLSTYAKTLIIDQRIKPMVDTVVANHYPDLWLPDGNIVNIKL